MADDLTDTIADLAQNPAKITGDAGSLEEQPLDKVIQASQHLAAQAGASKPARGMRVTKIVNSGSA